MAPCVLLIFAKVPEAGCVKTRLFGVLSPQEAERVHTACLQDTVRHVARVPGCSKGLWVAALMPRAQLLAAALGVSPPWRVGVQFGRVLGERLHQAFQAFFRAGYGKVVVTGSDTPWMGSERMQYALALLDKADVVLGPTFDGGYYLVGARRLVPALFRGIPWSTPHVFERTIGALEKAHVRYRLLPRDFDLDRPEDLKRVAALLRGNADRAPALALLIAQWSSKWGL